MRIFSTAPCIPHLPFQAYGFILLQNIFARIERRILSIKLDNTQNGMLVNTANTINSSSYVDMGFPVG
jgi:hypothetical protein